MTAPRDFDEGAAGEDVLARLRVESADLTAAQLHDLLAGIAAAPMPRHEDDWPRLVVSDPSPALRARLIAMRDAILVGGDGIGGVTEGRVAALRAELTRQQLDGFVIPRADEHQGEYVAKRAQRLAWLTGFTGSAGVAIVMADKAAIFVDGRYTLQVGTEVDTATFQVRHLVDQPPPQWIVENLKPGARLGYDPWLHALDGVERLRAACERAGALLVACGRNPVDAVWANQPPPPLGPVSAHPVAFAGSTAADKRREVAAALAADKVAAAVLTQPDSIAWLLNLRGADVPYTPLPLSFAIAHADTAVELFVDRRKMMPGVIEQLGDAVRLRAPDELGAGLDALGGKRVRIEAATTPAWIADRLQGAEAILDRGADPCALPKACKNAVELDGMRAAHCRDGAALTRFLAWLAREAPKGGLREIAASDRLEAFRAENERFQGLSFPTISGAGPNGAIVHYRSTPESERELCAGELYLLDSGAQYLDGTTDVTRTLAIGTPGAEERRRFTLVLKGHIGVATVVFPAGTTGSQLDVLARQALWREGLDYDHGTGHGVGSFLSVHEGPQRISKVGNSIALKPGMILSNEPGYYKTGAYGIRIENLVAVASADVPGAERPMFRFETLTLAPIDLALVDRGMLDDAEAAWLNAYHARVREELTPLLDAETASWLAEATRAI